MTPIKQFLILFLTIFLSQVAFAEEKKLTFEPLYGVETSLVRYPEPARYVTRATYGLRLLYGMPQMSGEAEYTTAKSRNDYASTDTKVEDTVERLSLGLRSSHGLTKYFGFFFRAGGRASQGETIVTTAGEAQTKENPLRIDPYAGAGISFSLFSGMGINAGATMFRNAEGKYDAQYTLGLSARFGKL